MQLAVVPQVDCVKPGTADILEPPASTDHTRTADVNLMTDDCLIHHHATCKHSFASGMCLLFERPRLHGDDARDPSKSVAAEEALSDTASVYSVLTNASNCAIDEAVGFSNDDYVPAFVSLVTLSTRARDTPLETKSLRRWRRSTLRDLGFNSASSWLWSEHDRTTTQH